jgi:hypothetical protein
MNFLDRDSPAHAAKNVRRSSGRTKKAFKTRNKIQKITAPINSESDIFVGITHKRLANPMRHAITTPIHTFRVKNAITALTTHMTTNLPT